MSIPLIWFLPDSFQSFSVDPFTSSIDLGFCNLSLAPEVCLDPGVTAPLPEAPDSFVSDEQSLRIEELQSELSSLKKQLLAALRKSKHVVDNHKKLQDALRELTRLAEREMHLLDMFSRARDDLSCK
jgi:hypothetical protein